MCWRISGALSAVAAGVAALVVITTPAEYRTGIEVLFVLIFAALAILLFWRGSKSAALKRAARNDQAQRKAADGVTAQRLQRLKDLYVESAEIMGRTTKLTTFLGRHEDARRFIRDFNAATVQAGREPIPEIEGDVDRLFVDRIGEVVGEEVAAALLLKTAAGRQDRLQKIVEELEGFDRPDDGVIDDAIMEAEGKVFDILEKYVDWSKEPADNSIAIDEDVVVGIMKESVIAEAKKNGFSDAQIRKVVKEVFDK